jgi:hypothetical protein
MSSDVEVQGALAGMAIKKKQWSTPKVIVGPVKNPLPRRLPGGWADKQASALQVQELSALASSGGKLFIRRHETEHDELLIYPRRTPPGFSTTIRKFNSRCSFDARGHLKVFLALEISFQHKRNPARSQRIAVSDWIEMRDCCHGGQKRRTVTQKTLSSMSNPGHGSRRFITASY